MKNTKKSLTTSVVALLLCFSMLLGVTYAWFTDVATSNNNIVQTGNLDAKMYWSDTLLAADSDAWKNAEGVPIFTYDNWEPGYTDVKYVKVENAGDFAFQWRLSIEAQGNVPELADVIDVYYINPVTETVTTLSGKATAGVLSDVINTQKYTNGVLLPAGETSTEYDNGAVILAIALHMQEDAGNEYRGDSIGAGFAIRLIATQFNYEEDGFGNNDYDKEPEWPGNVTVGGNSASADVETNNGLVSAPVSLLSADGVIGANVPAGVKLNAGVNKLTLSVSDVENSQANITLSENEASLSVDVHIDGVATDNDVVMAISIKELLPVGLNMGNYRFYHVEDGQTVEMTLLADGAVAVHNNYEYDPATGDVVLYLKSFSEVALVADTENAWEGEFDYTWYDASKTELTIANADQLAAFGAIVGGMKKVTGRVDGKYTYSDEVIQDSFEGKTVKLIADINLGDDEKNNNPNLIFYPIGYWNNEGTYERKPVEERVTAVSSGFYSFDGTFDGNGNTISNFYQNTWEMKGDHNWYSAVTEQYFRDGMGLFGKVYGGTVKNLTIDNFSSDGEITTTGVIAAYADSKNGNPAIFENISITNCNPRVYNIGNGGIVGCAGWYSKDVNLGNADYTNAVTFRNITVDQTNMISALWGTYDVSCGGILGQYYPDSGCGIKLENCHVSAIIDVNNDVCANYQYYWYRYSGMFIGTIRANTTDEAGYTIADTTGIIATDCTYSYGSWNEYWYCELVKNSSASYTHDYQFGRLTNIDNLSEIKDGDTWLKEGNFALVSDDRKSVECYHIFKDSNGNLYRHFHDVADESNPNIYEDFDLNGDGELNDLKEDRQRYYLPFGQVFNGLGYGVKPTYTYEGFELIEDGTVISGTKFEVKNDASSTYKPGDKIYLKDLVSLGVDISKLSQSSLYVAASPIGEEATVSIDYRRDVENWENNYFVISDDAKGAIKLVITDYFYCTPTVIILNEQGQSQKFAETSVGTPNAYTRITLGELFGIVDGANIGNVTATVTNPDGNEISVTGTSSDWRTKTIDLVKEGTWTVVIMDDDKYCATTTNTFTVNKADKFKSKFTGNFLYRVGNANTVALTSLFADLSVTIAPQNLNVTVDKVKGDAAGTFTNDAIKFTGTGVVKVTISADGANSVELMLEVVDANNVTRYSELKEQNSVLLADITMSSGGTYRLTGNKVLYGNGFTFDVTNGAYEGVQYDYMSYVIYLENSCLDNVIIKGAVYPDIGGTKADSYNRAIVMTNGTCKITNSFISNGASPIRNGGNLELVNTTLKGGIYANLDLRNGHLILDNVTTINQIDSNEEHTDSNGKTKKIVGMGIVVYQEGGTDELKITIRNNLTQYNYLSKTQADEHFTDTYRSAAKGVVFGNDLNAYQNNGWINFGIVSMNSYLTAEDIVDERTDKAGYFGTPKTVTLLGNSRNCYVYSFKPTTTSVPAYPGYTTAGQGVIAPTVEFDFTDKNYQPKVEGSNDYCYADGKTVYISMDEGDSFVWDTSILTATKNGNALNYTVKIDGVDYTGKSFTFNTSGKHTVTYSYTDTYNYTLENGTVATFSKEYSESIEIEVSVVKATAKHAEFSFGANGTAYSAKIVTIGDKTYVMPDVTATVSGKIGSKTVNGTTVYYPITEMYTSDGETAHSGSWYACFPIFKDALQIIDYADQGTGDPVEYNQKTVTTVKEIPSTLKAVDPKTAFLYSMNATNYPPPTDPTAVSGAVCYTCNRNGLTSSNTRKEENTVAEYTYTDNAGTVYYYYIGYHCAEQTSGSPCVTPDTLITLADGTQVRVDSLTGDELLLVWNLETGKLDYAPIMFVDSDPTAEFEVIKLIFSDGTEVKVIGEHGFWDYDLNKYVYLDANAADYIGHTFAKQNGDVLEKVQLVDVVIETEVTTSWSPVTVGHLCYFVNGMLSMPGGVGGLFNIFEVDPETMTYDYEQIEKDIETYGLYTYEELNAICPLSEDMFNAAGGAYLKISIGKGNLTIDELIDMITRYSKYI